MDQSFGPPTKEGQAMSRGNNADETEMGVTVIGTGDGTAHDRNEVNKEAMMESIVRGLQNAARMNSTSQLPTRTSESNIGVVSKGREDAEESKRWSAPETANEVANVDVKKVLVFGGLVLWEIETGQVPFRELDAVNAQRQIRTGILPRMETITNSETG
ncbi:hypothetical protein BLNAU_23610 [Blattamonas nauphoetae]|uniref:Uncharacterized protein n=1 Tax=Blattamonas nauphoetae TaxID=2049346 RepID=A0ABQ9WQ61_9EUKA|nr:hypothetical protein BLNAU_23610 [Blattamonas nauphoetae]